MEILFLLVVHFSKSIVHSEYFSLNPDSTNPEIQYKTRYFKENYGLDNVKMSWGHDEYLYQIVKDYLPQKALYMIRYHSFYAQHKEQAYDYLMNDPDLKMFDWVSSMPMICILKHLYHLIANH